MVHLNVANIQDNFLPRIYALYTIEGRIEIVVIEVGHHFVIVIIMIM